MIYFVLRLALNRDFSPDPIQLLNCRGKESYKAKRMVQTRKTILQKIRPCLRKKNVRDLINPRTPMHILQAFSTSPRAYPCPLSSPILLSLPLPLPLKGAGTELTRWNWLEHVPKRKSNNERFSYCAAFCIDRLDRCICRNFGVHWSGGFNGCNEEHGGTFLPQTYSTKPCQSGFSYVYVSLSLFSLCHTLPIFCWTLAETRIKQLSSRLSDYRYIRGGRRVYTSSLCVCVERLNRRKTYFVVFNLVAGASGPSYLPDATKLWYDGGRVNWSFTCTRDSFFGLLEWHGAKPRTPPKPLL